MTITQLQLYNGALTEFCGERPLSSLSEQREPRRLLDEAWSGGGDAKRACLEQGQWNFAMRTQKLTYDTSITPDFGYPYVFQKPSDWVLTTGIWQDEFMRVPLLQYTDEAGYLYANLQTIYWRYISDDATSYGGNLDLWPASFSTFVKAWLASKIIGKLTDSKERIEKLTHPRSGQLIMALRHAKSISAMAEPTKMPPEGSWNRARRGGGSRRDGGNTNSLIG